MKQASEMEWTDGTAKALKKLASAIEKQEKDRHTPDEDYYSNPELPPAEIHTIPFYKFFSSGKSTSGNPDYWGKIENISEDWNIIHNAFSLNKNNFNIFLSSSII